MKIEVVQEFFAKILASTLGAVPVKSTTPVLSHVALEADGGNLRILGTDLEMSIVRETKEVRIDAEGSVTVPAKKLFEIVGAFPPGPLCISADEKHKVSIRSGKSEATLTGGLREDFPTIPAVGDETVFSLPADRLALLLERTTFAAGSEEVRTFLNGANFSTSGKTLRVVATDGHRLAFAEETLGKAVKGKKEADVVVPLKALRELRRILPEEGDVDVSISGNQIAFSMPGATLSSRLIAEPFPNYQAVIPKKTTSTARLDAADFAQALVRALPIAEDKSGSVRLSFSDKGVRVTAESSEIGTFKDEVPASLQGNAVEIAFNAKYLLDYLRVLAEGEVEVRFTESTNPAILRRANADEDGSFYVVMPMRI